jgi:hypothetical protein
MHRMRSFLRYAFVLLGGSLAGTRVVDAARSWREWHRWAVTDPSAADLYRTDFMLDAGIVLVVLAGAGLVYRILGRRPNDEGSAR